MTKKLITFDLDDTLAVTKTAVEARMADSLMRLAGYFDICIITGGRYEQLLRHVVAQLDANPALLTRFHLLPLSGAVHYAYDVKTAEWQGRRYIPDLEEEEKKHIIAALESTARQLGYWEENPRGNIIEDRSSQITFSALGQEALPADKYEWDPDFGKRQSLQEAVSAALPDFEVRINGNTSLDITRQGMDKGKGMENLLKEMSLGIEDVLFIGDQLYESGNDYPVKVLGIDTISVRHFEETLLVIAGILGVSARPKGARR